MGRKSGTGAERATNGKLNMRLVGARRLAVAFALGALLLLVVSSAGSAAAPPVRLQSAAGPLPSATIPATQVNLNLSESGTSYYPEYFTLNNTSTIYKLPYTLTSRYSWVTVLNLSRSAGNFHSINYAQVTTANDSGTVVAAIAQTSFEARGGNAYWIDYTYWTYTIYGLSAPSLSKNGFNGEGTFTASFGHYPGRTTGPGNLTFALNGTTVYDLKVPSNVTAQISAPASVSVPAGCTAWGAHCVTIVWDFLDWTQGSTVETTGTTLILGGSTGLSITPGVYQNYTASYSDPINETGTSGSGGAFIASGLSVFNEVFLQFWYVWVLLVVLLVAYAAGRRRRR